MAHSYLVSLLFVGLCVVRSLGLEITRDELPKWLSQKHIDEFHQLYLKLDYNNDDFVSFGELKLGLVSDLDHKIFSRQYEIDKEDFEEDIEMRDEYWTLDATKEKFNDWFQHKPESYSCVPTLDPVCLYLLF